MIPTFRIRMALSLIALGFVLLSRGSIVTADIIGQTNFEVDLTNADEAKQKLRWLGGEKALQVTPKGLGWNHPENEKNVSRDFWIETTKPIGLGESWRPTQSVIITATITPPVSSGQLFVRYSADAKHWSSWQVLNEPRRLPENAVDIETYQQEIRVPYRSQRAFQKELQKYARRDDVAWGSDEEALCKELTAKNPNYFRKTIPFVGYVQFLYEGSLPSGQRIRSMKVQMHWGVGGVHTLPKDGNAYKAHQGVWRFKLPDQ